MIRKVFISLLLFPFFISAQNKFQIEVENSAFTIDIKLPNVKYKDIKKGKFRERDYFESEDYSKAGQYNLPAYHCIVAIPPNSKPIISEVNKKETVIFNVVPSRNPRLLKVNDTTLVKDYNFKTYPKKYEQELSDFEIENYFWYRDFYCVAIKINTHKFFPRQNEIKEIKEIGLKFSLKDSPPLRKNTPLQIRSKFDIELKNILLNAPIAEQFRNQTLPEEFTDSTGAWIDFNSPYLKISVIEDGIYRLSKENFTSLGIDVHSINPKTFQLFEKGKEIPILVEGQEDGTFDDNEFIEFYGHKNYGGNYREINLPDEDYNEYLNRFTDSTFYFLTWGNVFGKRVLLQNEFTVSLGDTIDYSLNLTHYEVNNWVQNLYGDEAENQLPNWHRNKSWYWQWLGDWNSPRRFDFFVNDVVNNKKAKIFFKTVSGGSNVSENSHQVALYFNNEKLDSENVNRFHQVLLSGEFSTNLLSEGKNSFKVFNYKNGTVPNFLAVDWYDIEYPQNLKFTDDSLTFIVPNDISAGEKIFEIGNANENEYVIYRTSPNLKKVIKYSVKNNNLFFSDTIKGGEKYTVFALRKILYPQNIRRLSFTNIRANKEQADYLIITHRKFLQAVNDYADFIQDNFGVKTRIVLINDIYEEFGYGYPTTNSVKEFLKFAFWKWNSPKFSYLELIGDASYDYKYIRYKNEGVKVSTNYVPSYGFPVGDNWYAIWNDSDPPLPQFKLGRLPINSSEQLYYYLNKIKENKKQRFTDWNKHFLFFSGGDNPSESDNMKLKNDEIISKYIVPPPIAGKYFHFYKTYNPVSSLGPYSQEEIQNAIDKGGIFISYLGHSGTATWDNGINSVRQIENKVGRYPLITDFGCSTNKFAEPASVSFGERFLFDPHGQALAYNGNSSFGLFSTVNVAPPYFYQEILSDSLHEIGNASLFSKAKVFEKLGQRIGAKVFALTNVVLGDPIVRLNVANKPNLSISAKDIILPSDINSEMDSINLKIAVNNFGLVFEDSLNVKISHFYSDSLLESKIVRLPLPYYSDTLSIKLLVNKSAGKHKIKVELDKNNEIDEIYEDDNVTETTFDVFSLAVRDLLSTKVNNGCTDSLTLLLPTVSKYENYDLLFETSSTNDFNSPVQHFYPSKLFAVKVPVGKDLNQGEREWFRIKINKTGEKYSEAKSFSKSSFKYSLNDSIGLTSVVSKGIEYNDKGFSLSKEKVTISVLSAGAYAGATCTISKNGKNLLGNTFFAGMSIVVFDPITMDVDTAFGLELFMKPQNVQAMADFINSIQYGKIVAMGVSDDARNNISNELRNAIKTLGSTKIDLLVFQGPWALIGWKGAPAGSVVEEVGGRYDPPIIIDSTFIVNNMHGYILTENIGSASHWDSIKAIYNTPSNSNIRFQILGITENNKIDSLGFLNFSNSLAYIDSVSTKKYPYLKLKTEFFASDSGLSPVLNFLGVDYKGSPEIGTNNRMISLSADSVMQNEDITLNFSVFNAGENLTDTCSVKTYLIKTDKSEKILLDTLLVGLNNFESKNFTVIYHTNYYDGYGEMKFRIALDEENKIKERFKDNNVFTLPFYVLKDTSIIFNSARFDVLFDGENIFDGDYVSSSPTITFKINYTFGFDYNDSSAFNILIDNTKVPFASLKVNSVDTVKNEIVMNYQPTLSNGEHSLNISGTNIFSAEDNSPGYFRTFRVSNKLKLLNVFNYPNPFEEKTYFTFSLTKIPEKLSIKIYTIAGRLIKIIELYPSELKMNFNSIDWDGRDQDGDEIANGVYFYKIILKKGNETVTKIQKMARVR